MVYTSYIYTQLVKDSKLRFLFKNKSNKFFRYIVWLGILVIVILVVFLKFYESSVNKQKPNQFVKSVCDGESNVSERMVINISKADVEQSDKLVNEIKSDERANRDLNCQVALFEQSLFVGNVKKAETIMKTIDELHLSKDHKLAFSYSKLGHNTIKDLKDTLRSRKKTLEREYENTRLY